MSSVNDAIIIIKSMMLNLSLMYFGQVKPTTFKIYSIVIPIEKYLFVFLKVYSNSFSG